MRHKFYKNLILWSLLTIIATPFASLRHIFVTAQNQQETKIFSNATIDSNFACDRVLVVLDKDASFNDKEYNKNDFKKFDCKDVKDLTIESTKVIQKKSNNALINVDSYRRVLSLELENTSKQNILNVIDELMERNDIIYAGPDYKLSISSTISNDSKQNKQWAIDALDLPEAWDFSTGSNEVIVGVLDTGIDGAHPDFQRYNDELLESSNIEYSLCYDFTSGQRIQVNMPTDDHGHGTHVAGIIGAMGNNNDGIAGVNWNIKLASLKVFDSFGMGYSSYTAEAIRFAQEVGIPILNLSGRWYTQPGSTPVELYDYALDTVIQSYNGLIVCCAGNESRNNDALNPALPASYNLENLISVGSLNSEGDRSSSSNYGQNTVDIYAPGDSIYSTRASVERDNDQINNSWYTYKTGTSQATPHVTGVAALLLSMKPDLTPVQLKTAILNSAVTTTITVPNDETTDPNDTTTQTVKSLNAFNAVKYILNTYLTPATVPIYGEASFTGISGLGYLGHNAHIKLAIDTAGEYDFSINSNCTCVAYLYDSNWNEIDIIMTSTQNGYQLDFSEELSVGDYYLRVYYSNLYTTLDLNFHISGPPHVHNYTGWKYYDRSSHIQLCDCGETGTVTQAHAVLPKDRDKPFAYCIGCGNLLDLRFDLGEHPGIESFTRKVSLNGSYTLPNGIIVLVEEDIEAYMNNTLVFYDEDNLPQTA